MGLSVFFIFVIILFGLLAILPYYKKKTKSKVMKICAIIYNLIFGFYGRLFFSAFYFFAWAFKISDLLESIFMYMLLLIPINIVFKVRGKINIKKYLIMSSLSILTGFALCSIIIFIAELIGFNILKIFW